MRHIRRVMDYSSKEARSSGMNDRVTTRLKAFNQDSKISVQISRLRTYESPLKAKYDVAKYNLATNYIFGDKISDLIPKNTPEYVDEGQNYIERIMCTHWAERNGQDSHCIPCCRDSRLAIVGNQLRFANYDIRHVWKIHRAWQR